MLAAEGTAAKEKPPIFGMIQRGGEVAIQMLENVKKKTIEPIIKATIKAGTLIFTDEYTIYNGLTAMGYGHKQVALIGFCGHGQIVLN